MGNARSHAHCGSGTCRARVFHVCRGRTVESQRSGIRLIRPGSSVRAPRAPAALSAKWIRFSPINPATIGAFSSRILFFQMEPEYRSVTTNSGTERTTTARYPVVFGAMPVRNFVVSLSASSLLDRTATTSFNTTQLIGGGQTVPMTTTYRIDGAIDDVRLAAAWTSAALAAGRGRRARNYRAATWSASRRRSPIRSQFAAFTQQRVLGYNGTAGSLGIQLLSSQVVASASARFGGRLRLSSEDTLLSTANVPNEFGGIDCVHRHYQHRALGPHVARQLVGARRARNAWAHWRGRLGHERRGRFRRSQDWRQDRLPARRLSSPDACRSRPSNQTVTEKSFSGGLGTGFANGRVLTDLALIRASRSADLPASEHAWTISIGISVRP